MTRNFKYFSLILMITMLFSACNVPDNNTDPKVLYTIAASTIQAENNRIASLTPPTPTFTPTETATVTPTATETLPPTPEPTATWVNHPAGAADVLILYYNDVANSSSDDPFYQWESTLNVTSAEFEQQVRVLSELGYNSITLSQLVNVLLEGGELPARPVMFTFDSSKLGQYRNAFPILTRYGMVGNLMLVANQVDTQNCLSSEQVREMMDAGWEIGSSGFNRTNDPAYYGQEIGRSKITLEEKFGVPILVYAYPGGIIDADSVMVQKVSEALYKAAMGKQRTIKQSRDILYYLGRYEIVKGMSYADFAEILPWKEGNVSQETMDWTQPKPSPTAEVQLTPPAP